MRKNFIADICEDLKNSEYFPKMCGTCDRVYRTPADIIARTAPIARGDLNADRYILRNGSEAYDLNIWRNCRCGSTLSFGVTEKNLAKDIVKLLETPELLESFKEALYDQIFHHDNKLLPFRVLTYDEHRSGIFQNLKVKNAELLHTHNFIQAKAKFKENPEGTSMILFNLTENRSDGEREFTHYVKRRKEHGIDTTIWALTPHLTTDVPGADYTLPNSLPIEYLGEEIGRYIKIEKKNYRKQKINRRN